MNETKCFFYGIGLGLAAGVLFAPRSGDKTRRQLAESARDGQNRLVREGTELRDSVVEKLNRARRAAEVTAHGIGVALEVGKEQLVG